MSGIKGENSRSSKEAWQAGEKQVGNKIRCAKWEKRETDSPKAPTYVAQLE